MKQLLHRNNPWSGSACYRAASCLSCASNKDRKDDCSKRSIVYEVHCETCRQHKLADASSSGDTEQLEQKLDYIYVGQTSESCYVRGKGHQDSMKTCMNGGVKGEGKGDTSHMAIHVNMTHGGRASEAKFIMKKVRSYQSTFLRILAECIRIKYRLRETGVVVLNQKSGDFGSYSLPRLSMEGNDQEREPKAPAHVEGQPGDERRESKRWAANARKGKFKFKQKI